MNRILLAAAAVIGLTGAAAAQQSPYLHGNYSASVLNDYNGTALPGDNQVDLSSTAAIRNAPATGEPAYDVQGLRTRDLSPSSWETRSGR
jgi:hypothetical protein